MGKGKRKRRDISMLFRSMYRFCSMTLHLFFPFIYISLSNVKYVLYLFALVLFVFIMRCGFKKRKISLRKSDPALCSSLTIYIYIYTCTLYFAFMFLALLLLWFILDFVPSDSTKEMSDATSQTSSPQSSLPTVQKARLEHARRSLHHKN